MDVPGATDHPGADKCGYLNKLCGRSFPYIPSWRRRYCVLARGKLYYYEREDSRQGEKSNGVINLEYFDHVSEAGPKDCRKATNVFVVTSNDRSFFDPGRHLFSADTLPDMKDWIRKLQTALEQIRNNTRSSQGKEAKRRKEEEAEGKRRKEEEKENNASLAKDKKKKKEDPQRQRRTARVGASDEATPAVMAGTDTPDSPRKPPPMGIQLPGLAAQGIQLPGMVPRGEEEGTRALRESMEGTKEAMEVDDDGMPTAEPTLSCVTKRRVKGPSGRRAPQHRRTLGAMASQRASSLSALQYQELNDTRSEGEGGRESSGEPQEPREAHVRFDDIDNDLFFTRESKVVDGEVGDEAKENKVAVRSPSTKVNFEDKAARKSRTRSRSGTLLGTKLSRFRETVVSFKRSRFDAKEAGTTRHPDDADTSRWCTIL